MIWCPQVCVLWPHLHVCKVILTATQHIPKSSGHHPQGYYPQIRRGPKEEAFPYTHSCFEFYNTFHLGILEYSQTSNLDLGLFNIWSFTHQCSQDFQHWASIGKLFQVTAILLLYNHNFIRNKLIVSHHHWFTSLSLCYKNVHAHWIPCAKT